MECRDALEDLVVSFSGDLAEEERDTLAAHLTSCASCAAEAAALEGAWERLAEDPDTQASPSFRLRTAALLEEATRRRADRRVVAFPSRRGSWVPLQIAALVVVGVGGFLLARVTGGARPFVPFEQPEAQARLIPVVSQRTIDVTKTLPDLGSRPRLTNVAYRPADPDGRIAVSFDVTTRYTLLGKPEEKGIADVLAYLVSGAAGTEGARGQAIDLVSRQVAQGAQPSPQVVSVLVETLKSDTNPGVRKKTIEALVQLPPTPEIQVALMQALKTDTNPAVRILAVEGLAKGARELRDPASIETLREKASDAQENGYVRNQAALALRGIAM